MRGLATKPVGLTRTARKRPNRTAWPPVAPGGSPALRRGRCVTNAPAGGEIDEWITKRELAAHLKMTTRWIEYQQLLGLPVLRLGAANRYKISEVEAWLRERYHSESAGEES